ncbi:MAG: MFS transporter, partial [Actinomycetota bacterium]
MFTATGLTAAAAAVVAGRWLLTGTAQRDAGPPDPAAPDLTGPGDRSGRRWPDRPAAIVALLGAIGLCVLLGEGAVADWSAVYLRDNLGTSAGFAALGCAGFSIAMAAGRLAGDRLAAWFGPVRLVRCGSLLAGLGWRPAWPAAARRAAWPGSTCWARVCPASHRRCSWRAGRLIR